MKETMKKLFAAILALMMIAGIMPVNVIAEENEVLAQIITMSDYQNSSLSSSAKKTVPQTIVNAMVKAGVNPELALIGGDYTDGSVGADGDDTSQASLKTELNNLTGILTAAWSGLPYYAIQGNHDYSGFLTDGTLTATGAYPKDDYIIYLINEDSFPWWQGNYGSGSSTAQDKATVTATTKALSTYLTSLIDSGDTRPVIIMTHVPIHWSVRSANRNWYYDNIYANILFEAVNEAAKELDILFLFGHNHSSTGEGDGLGYDNEIGDALAYVAKGESMKVPNGTDGSANYTTETLNFTYMNAGYVGKYNGSTSDCSIAAVNIGNDSIVINRYTYNGTVHTETIELENSQPRVTITDTSTGVTLSLPSENTLSVNTVTVEALEEESLYTNYVAYEISLGSELAAGENARVTLPADDFTSRAKVYKVSANGSLTAMDVAVSDGKVNFTTQDLGIYAIAELNLPYVEIPVTGNVATGAFYHTTDELEEGQTYLLVSNDSYLKAIQDTGMEYTHSSWDFETTIATQAMTSETDSNGEYIQNSDESLMWEAVPGGIEGYYYLKNVNTGAYLRAGYSVDTTYGRNISTTSSKSDNYVNFKAVSSSGSGIYAVENSSNLSTYRWERYSNSDQWFQGRTSYQSGAVQLWKAGESSDEETTISVSMDDMSGVVMQNADDSAVVGAQLLVTYQNGSEEYIDITVGMLSDTNGNAVSTASAVTLTNLTVTYMDTVITTSFTLNVIAMDDSWVELPSAGDFVIDTDGVDYGAKYLIVSTYSDSSSGDTNAFRHIGYHALDSNAATTSSSYGTTPVYGVVATLSGSGDSKVAAIDEEYLDTALWTITEDGIVNESGKYVDVSSSAYSEAGSYYNMAFSNSSNRDWTIGRSGDYYTFTTTYNSNNYKLQYNSWRHSYMYTKSETSNLTFELYKAVSGNSGIFAHLSGEVNQSYTAADNVNLAAVLSQVTVQTGSSDANDSIREIAVTSDMVTWDKDFDGTTEGVYTGTVVYKDLEVGTITVTISVEHNFETITVEATCTEDGSITTKCTVCGEETVEVIKATGHSYECVETAATCGKDGSKVYTCATCNDTYTEVIEATGNHTFETITVDATCTEAGSVTTKCTVCGEETVEVIEAVGHNYECVITDATCAAEGSKVYTCSVCADTYTEVIPATGEHTYTCETVDATCTEAGSVTYTCSMCGTGYTEVIAALGHSYENTVTAATCTQDGYTTYTCSACGNSYQGETVAAFGHSYDSVITATCTESGFVVYTCKTCGHSYNGEEVAAYGHSYEAVSTAPTCTTTGYTTYICKTCGNTYTDDEVAALGHNYKSVVTEATCTEAGYTTYTCSVCDHSYVGDNVAALGHDYESVVTEPTFETEGYTTHTCIVCGDVKVDSYVPVLSHTYETVTTEATCTEDGSVVHTCVDCGYSYTEVLPALGHTNESVTTEATCTENGSIVTTCTVCGNTETEVIPAAGHSYETTKIAPTCTESGYTTYTCPCGYVVTEEIPATGHSYESSYTAPTCTENGGTTFTCGCGDVYTEVEAALGHSYEAVSTAPTCTAAGYTTYICAACGDSYTADEIAALGHSYESVVTEATCTEGGYTTHICTVCGDSYTDSTVAALGHSYNCVESDGYLVYTCDHCGDSYSEKIENLTYTRVSSISSGNNYVITLYSGRKYYALTHEDNKISVTQVTVSNKEITSEITEDMVWTYSGSKLSYEDDGTIYYLYAGSSSNNWWGNWWGSSNSTLSLSTSNSSTVSFSSSKLKIGSKYLRYSNGSATLSSSSTTTYFFIEE